MTNSKVRLKKIDLSIIVIAKNEKSVINDCLESAKFASEVILLDGGSTDGTLEIAKKFSVRIISQKVRKMNYSAWHNQGKKEAQGVWILYLDADERISPGLQKEIMATIQNPVNDVSAYALPRRNFLLGKELHFGGWYPDYQIRLFKKDELKKWVGQVHEQPEIQGQVGKLKNPLIHLQPETIEPALEKSIIWSEIEAKLLYQSGHPQVTWWRVLRMGATTLFERLIKKQGFRDGTEGWIESIYQAFHTMIVYIRLWEMQRK